MKIAILSDIHGNDEALKAVLSEIDSFKINKLLLLGDYVGYYYNHDEVFDLLTKYDTEMIKGNHEVLLENVIKNPKKALGIKLKFGSSLEFAKEVLSGDKLDFLINLPQHKILEIDGLKILMCHGSPFDNFKYIYPDTSEAIKQKSLESDYNFVFIGHSHYSFIYEYNNKFLVNVGSVGQNRKQGGVAEFALLDTESKICEIKKTPYNKDKIISQVKRIDPNNRYLADVLNRNSYE